MRKIIVLVSFMLVANLANSQKQNPNVIKLNPLGLLFGNASLAYERALNNKSSIVVAPTFGTFKSGDYKYSSFGLSGEYRFYTKNEAPKGFYLAPGLGFATGKVTIDNSSSEAKWNAVYGKAVLGKQWIWSSGFVLDLNGGVQYLSYNYTDNSSSAFNNLDASGILPALSFSIGYNF